MYNDFNFNLDFSAFAGGATANSEAFKTRYIQPPLQKEVKEENLKYAYARDLAKRINLDGQSRYFVVVNGSFYFGDFIEALLLEKKMYASEATISTLSMCQNNVDSLALLMNNKIVDKLHIVVSDYFYSHEKKDLIPYLYDKLDIDNRFQLAVAGTHCKMCLIHTVAHQGQPERFIVIHGSANMRSSGNIEQFVIEESKELYEFNYKYQADIIRTYKTINKAIRNKKLWKIVEKP